ncbi:peptide-methionine (R)-S-oxide reductase MsrB [Sphingomonas bacterium]|uniref:peptide-methionine (R)-S-oxide reductase MsrB n=1 Tax=Sphingomonas bacterium TaxID=1895847 RepID=UPI00157703D4|nr:peptide-methionine (R)-S-oxide reductase MsrB [Sphingomonas bacterium]
MTDLPDRRRFLALSATGIAGVALWGCSNAPARAAERFPVMLTDAQWRRKLSPAAYDILRHEGTETPYSSPLNGEHRAGTFTCAGCDQPAYTSHTKFESGTGWPSFWAPLPRAIVAREDSTLGMSRTEIHCSRCGGHLGHVFDDGPKPTGKRYCMNGAGLTFHAATA